MSNKSAADHCSVLDPAVRLCSHRRTRKKAKGDIEGTPEEGGDDDDDDDKQMELDLTQDENINPTPFTFKPFHLTSLVKPKNLESLEGMGGINGLLAGLGTNSANRLSIGGKKSEPGDALPWSLLPLPARRLLLRVPPTPAPPKIGKELTAPTPSPPTGASHHWN